MFSKEHQGGERKAPLSITDGGALIIYTVFMETTSLYEDFEHFYQKEVLSSYDLPTDHINWQSHDKIGNDTFAHYFSVANTNYALVFEDFPSESNFITEEGEIVLTKTNEQSVNLSVKDGAEYTENKTGFFTLYKLAQIK